MQTARLHCVEEASSAGKIIEFDHPWDVAAVTLSSFDLAALGPCPCGMRLSPSREHTSAGVRDGATGPEMGLEGLCAFSSTQNYWSIGFVVPLMFERLGVLRSRLDSCMATQRGRAGIPVVR